jgi:hypothetical protein
VFVYIVGRFEILKVLFPDIVEDIFDEPPSDSERTELLSGQGHRYVGNGANSGRSDGSLLAPSVDN